MMQFSAVYSIRNVLYTYKYTHIFCFSREKKKKNEKTRSISNQRPAKQHTLYNILRAEQRREQKKSSCLACAPLTMLAFVVVVIIGIVAAAVVFHLFFSVAHVFCLSAEYFLHLFFTQFLITNFWNVMHCCCVAWREGCRATASWWCHGAMHSMKFVIARRESDHKRANERT